jgi:hypothetical protein
MCVYIYNAGCERALMLRREHTCGRQKWESYLQHPFRSECARWPFFSIHKWITSSISRLRRTQISTLGCQPARSIIYARTQYMHTCVIIYSHKPRRSHYYAASCVFVWVLAREIIPKCIRIIQNETNARCSRAAGDKQEHINPGPLNCRRQFSQRKVALSLSADATFQNKHFLLCSKSNSHFEARTAPRWVKLSFSKK